MKVAIFGQYYQNDTLPIIKDIFVFFNKNKIDLVIEESFLKILHSENIIARDYKTFSTSSEVDKSFDVLISIGGDGTILRAITYVGNSGIPILGVNAGRLGFLAKVQKEDIHSFLQIVIDKKYTISERTLLKLETKPENKEIAINFALNEITVSRKRYYFDDYD